MTHNPVPWFEIYVQDMPAAQAFYEQVLGHSLSKLPAPEGSTGEMMAFPMEQDGPGASGALVKIEGVPSGSGGTMVYFNSQDVTTELDRVEAAGGKVLRTKMSIGQYGNIGIFQDIDGNVVGLHSQA